MCVPRLLLSLVIPSFDILMGRNAGVHTIGVSYGNGSRESLEKAGAEQVIDHFEDLEKVLMV